MSPENRIDAFASLPGDHCPYCEKVCLPESKSIQCGLSGIWFHALCVNISAGLYSKLTVVCEHVKNISYYCDINHCNIHVKQLVHFHYANLDEQIDLPSLRFLQTEQVNLYQLIVDLSNKLDNLNSSNDELHSEVKATSELISTEKSSDIILVESLASTFLTVVQELDDRQHRRNNVIIYNLPKTCPLKDEKWFTDLCKSIFNISVKANRVTRLGNLLKEELDHFLLL